MSERVTIPIAERIAKSKFVPEPMMEETYFFVIWRRMWLSVALVIFSVIVLDRWILELLIFILSYILTTAVWNFVAGGRKGLTNDW
jgi:hypothetical protein